MIFHELFMRSALDEAQKAFDLGEVPIGAVLTKENKIIASAFNQRQTSRDPTDHAEIRVLRAAAKLIGDFRLTGTTLYVTLEPCPMCLGALLQARIDRLVYGCLDARRLESQKNPGVYSFASVSGFGALEGNNHALEITGPVLKAECAKLLSDFFKAKR